MHKERGRQPTDDTSKHDDENLKPGQYKLVQENKETEETFEKETKVEESDDESSPRGVLEIPVTGSDSDNSSIDRTNSFESPVGRAAAAACEINYGTLRWKKLFVQIRKKSPMKFSTIPLLGGYGYSFSRKAFKKKLGRNHSAGEAIDCAGFVVPKPSWRNYSYQELKLATDDFSPGKVYGGSLSVTLTASTKGYCCLKSAESRERLVGKGGHAEVYKGFLPDGQVVAVKKIIKKQKNDEDRVGDFLSELGIIAHIDHPNTAKLIGFSADSGLHLVLQFSPHGSLATVLHGGSDEIIEWKVRYKVAIGIAEGLEYLHCDCQRRIIHRDITASNILLSENYEPQISDFGLAKWLPEKWIHHVISPIEGTFGYMAPEYFMRGIVHEKTDVFAFGVLLLELITGRRAVDSCRQSLVMWAKPYLDQNDVKEIADPRLRQDYNFIEMKRAMFTASMCIHHLPSMRPNMSRVVKLLRGENEAVDMKQKSMSMKAMLWDSCDMEDYSSTMYQQDLNRHMELVME